MFEPPIQPEELVQQLNAIRENPRSLIPKLEKQLPKFKGKLLSLTPSFSLTTEEGPQLWTETIEFLRKQKPLPPLKLHKGLCKSAQQHVVDLAKNDIGGHIGSNGSTMGERIRRYNDYVEGVIAQNVARELPFKDRDHAYETLTTLILDDGAPSRGHRLSLFSTQLRFIGSASCKGSTSILTVINMSSENMNIIEGVEPPENRSQYSDNQAPLLPGQKGTPLVTKSETGVVGYDPNEIPATKYPYCSPEEHKLPIIPEAIQHHLNRIRKQPQSLIPHLEKNLAQFDESGMSITLANGNYKSRQGKKAWNDAIQFLKLQQPLHPMTVHSGLCKSAQSHAVDLSKYNLTGHTGSNGKNLIHRVCKFNKWETFQGGPGGAIGENEANVLSEMGQDFALEALIAMIIDDGVSNKCNREAVFSRQYRYFGSSSCWCNEHAIKTVINFSQNDLIPIEGVAPPINAGKYTGTEGSASAASKTVNPGKPIRPVAGKMLPSTVSVAVLRSPKMTVETAPKTKTEVVPKPPAVKKTVSTKVIGPQKPVATTPKPAAKPVANLTTSQAKLKLPSKK